MSGHQKTLGTVEAGEGVTLTLQSIKVTSGPYVKGIFGIKNPGMLTVTATGFYSFEEEEGVGPQPFETRFLGSSKLDPGPVLMIFGKREESVDTPERFGKRFGREWVRRFYLDRTV